MDCTVSRGGDNRPIVRAAGLDVRYAALITEVLVNHPSDRGHEFGLTFGSFGSSLSPSRNDSGAARGWFCQISGIASVA